MGIRKSLRVATLGYPKITQILGIAKYTELYLINVSNMYLLYSYYIIIKFIKLKLSVFITKFIKSTKMKKAILVSMIAVIALMTLTFVSASTGSLTTDWEVKVDGASVDGSTVSGIEAGQTIPLKIVFTALDCAEDVKVEAEIDYKDADIQDRTDRFDIVEGSTYTKRLSLELPTDIDPTEELTLTVTITDGNDKDTEDYTIMLQRESYNIEVLDVDAPTEAEAGSVIALDIVLKNLGMHDLEDVFVKATIPELGVQKKVYFGDLNPLDECEVASNACSADDASCMTYFKDCGREDAALRRLYLTIPENAKSGVYNIEVEAYNGETTQTAKKSIVISGTEGTSSVLTGTSSKSLSIGGEATYDIVIVNSGSKMKVYTLTPEQTNGLIVTTDSIVTVPADSSRTVRVNVKATESANEGTQLVKINVESEGQLVQQAVLSANVEKTSSMPVTNSVVVLTIVLVIVFVVLLIILIVLLTKRPANVETEETSYY